MADYDVIIIGAGPGGYVCAIRCAQLGLETAVVEARDSLGGTCLNVGCIPSKALLHASHLLHEARHTFARMGLSGAAPEVDWPRMQSYKTEVIGQNTKGIEFLFKKNGVTWIKGHGRLRDARTVDVAGKPHTARSVVIATGSAPATLPGVTIDEKVIVSSTGALELARIPRRLIVIGAGVIGLEMGSVYARLGAEVQVIEYLDAITPGMDSDIQGSFRKLLHKQGIGFVLGAAVQGAELTQAGARVRYTLRKDGSAHEAEADTVLVATGRTPHTEGLGLDALGIEMTARGQIRTDGQWRTSLPGLYAIGDVIAGPMLAHKAEDEGIAVAETIAGRRGHVNYDVIPGVIYTHPEVAAVGKTEDQLKDEGRTYRVGRFSFMGNGRAKAVFAGEGFVKLLADAQTGRVLGCHMIGPGAGDLIHEICVGMQFGAAAEDIARTCHAHPTFSEAVREAALACGDGAIHA
ncbi:dihydrolipoyl dehydrogenase [Maliponia aquimaris]|uniref:Dihydrolipoyl dehydrogenase n=1 Tax=Maliponia aquimaris TaxID=1673631 RepID=A0A238K4X1_9RHOB|nr:dihydrolipoyl dehydrogenase [Maliponia aquimaris]SMX37909.1 Dihydrolipoyl dehydrogenase 3 [Maliponia aquimaris]